MNSKKKIKINKYIYIESSVKSNTNRCASIEQNEFQIYSEKIFIIVGQEFRKILLTQVDYKSNLNI